METTRNWEPTPEEAARIAAARLESEARMRRRRLREHAETLAAHLRVIVRRQDRFFDANDRGEQAAFQAAADAFHDAIDGAADFLRSIGEQTDGGAA